MISNRSVRFQGLREVFQVCNGHFGQTQMALAADVLSSASVVVARDEFNNCVFSILLLQVDGEILIEHRVERATDGLCAHFAHVK